MYSLTPDTSNLGSDNLYRTILIAVLHRKSEKRCDTNISSAQVNANACAVEPQASEPQRKSKFG
jgi:hypothetical protein